jgi:hypothetical protein
MTRAPSIFESFNARALTPAQVAETFVPSDQFRKLTKRRHTIVLGPRGSGKTTLLKMLQPAALEVWRHSDADEVRAAVDFTGVFIATDIAWGEQLQSIGGGKIDSQVQKTFSIATFTTHVFRCLVNTFISRKLPEHPNGTPYRRLKIDASEERVIAGGLCKEWHLSDTVPSFLAVRHALSARLSTIKELVARELMLGVNGRDARLLDAGFLFLDFVQGCTNAIELFDDSLSKGETRWALMFDELELAPEWISNLLVRSIRSTDERLLFKLALNPFTNTSTQLESPTSPAPGQDFDQIALWYAEKRDSYEFCSQLFAQLLENRGLVLKEPRKILGNSYFETTDEEWRDLGNAYAPGSKIATRFKRLYEIDQSFRDYLDRRGLHPDRLHQLGPNQRASDVRKIAPIVAVREFFRSADWRRDARTRSRKLRASLYAGAESIFAISEGNPRWFIAIVEDLLDEWGSKRDRIPEHVQADELQKAAERFAAMLKTIPTESQTTESVFKIVKSVARYFNRHVVKEDFRPEPPGTFRVDDQCSDEIVSILGQALNAGGIVYVPDEDGQLSFTSLRHKRFRVSYLIAPLYGIPIRLGPVVNLSTILGSKRAAPSLPGLLPFPRSSGEEEADG